MRRWVYVTALTVACSSGAPEEPDGRECVPGETIACGARGAATCAEDGSAFLPCQEPPEPPRSEPPPEPEPELICPPRAVRACLASNGAFGEQVCSNDGESYGPCVAAETPPDVPEPEPLPLPPLPPPPPEPEPEPGCACFAGTTYAVTCGPLTVRCDDTRAPGEAPCGSLTEFEEQVYWDNQVRLVQASYTPATGAPFAAPVSSCTGSLVQAIAGDLYPIETVYGTPGCTCRVSPFAIQCSGTQTTELGCGGGL